MTWPCRSSCPRAVFRGCRRGSGAGRAAPARPDPARQDAHRLGEDRGGRRGSRRGLSAPLFQTRLPARRERRPRGGLRLRRALRDLRRGATTAGRWRTCWPRCGARDTRGCWWPAGSPGTRGDLVSGFARAASGCVFVTEETTPNRKTVGSLLGWSDIAAVWTSTEISHKATAVLRGPKVLKVPEARRGGAGLRRAGPAARPPAGPARSPRRRRGSRRGSGTSSP